MINLVEYFVNLYTIEQVRFLKEKGERAEDYIRLNRAEKIEFLKSILKRDLSSKTTASVIKNLRELGYNDRYFYRKFLLHVDSSVVNAARKAVKECSTEKDTDTIKALHSFEEGGREEKVRKITSFLEKETKLNEEVLISLLKSDDLRIRETLIKGITEKHEFDEQKLIETLKKGAAWYVRSGVVAILGARRSSSLLAVVDILIQDNNVEVRLELIDALAKQERDKIKPYLEKLTQDPLVWVRKKAKRTLAKI